MKIKYVFYSLFINTTLIILFLEVNKSKKADFIFNLFNSVHVSLSQKLEDLILLKDNLLLFFKIFNIYLVCEIIMFLFYFKQKILQEVFEKQYHSIYFLEFNQFP